MIKRYPHTFTYTPKAESTLTGGVHLPSVSGVSVNFEGRFTSKPQVLKGADGSMSQVIGKINCPVLDTIPKKGGTIEYGERSFTVFQADPSQKAMVIWVQ